MGWGQAWNMHHELAERQDKELRAKVMQLKSQWLLAGSCRSGNFYLLIMEDGTLVELDYEQPSDETNGGLGKVSVIDTPRAFKLQEYALQVASAELAEAQKKVDVCKSAGKTLEGLRVAV